MRVAVMGAGAVGCYYGAMLARAGHDVVLIARQTHVDAIRANGLRFQTATLDVAVPLTAAPNPDAIAGADYVLFCVKSTDTEAAARQMQPYLGADTLIVSLQNGVENAERLREVLTQPVAAAVVYVAAAMAGPGHVVHHGRGELVIEAAGESTAAWAETGASAAEAEADDERKAGASMAAARRVQRETLARTLTDAGVPAELSGQVRRALWSKLITNCAYNALSAITQQPYGPLVEGVGIDTTMDGLIDECLQVAAAEGVSLPDDLRERIAHIAVTMPGQRSSTAQDLARGKLTEIDHLNGLIVRRAAAHGLTAPLNQAMYALVKVLESKAPAAA